MKTQGILLQSILGCISVSRVQHVTQAYAGHMRVNEIGQHRCVIKTKVNSFHFAIAFCNPIVFEAWGTKYSFDSGM